MPPPSIDSSPWEHPFLSAVNLRHFRAYSEGVWDFALKRSGQSPRPLDVAFAVNMAQNMYKWAKLGKKYGSRATLYLHPQDTTAISRPEWEEFDGEFENLMDGPGFLRAHPGLRIGVPLEVPPNEGSDLWSAYEASASGWRRLLQRAVGAVAPEAGLSLFAGAAARQLRARSPSVRHAPLLNLEGAYPNFRWAEMLSRHEVIYAASTPFPAYASGKPYCVCPVGGDLQLDCGRTDDHGRAMRMSFAGARFILASNPHVLAHCRRLGFRNAVYLPYPMDSDHYCPGPGSMRQEWTERFGGSVFILSAVRLDDRVKGQDDRFFQMLADVCRARPEVRFIFLGWGKSAGEFQQRVDAEHLKGRLIMLPPVGKQRLIDYYRSSDVVLDQFVYGYYGATALEAAAIGKPLIMKQRAEQYGALYAGDLAPVLQAENTEEVRAHLLAQIDAPQQRLAVGAALREWLVRNHGEQKTTPLMLAILQLAADQVSLPSHLASPLNQPLTPAERAYHRTKARAAA